MTLTPRQQEVLALYREGHTYASIARELGMAERTARQHMCDVRERMGLIGVRGREFVARLGRMTTETT